MDSASFVRLLSVTSPVQHCGLLMSVVAFIASGAIDAEQLHVSITGENRITVSWASPTGQAGQLVIEEVASYGVIPGTRRTIKPASVMYELKCGRRYIIPCKLETLYESPLLLHADVPVNSSTNYRYCIVRAAESSDWRQLRTPPAPGQRELRIAVVGDLGQTLFSAMTCADLAREHKNRSLDLAVLVGDLAYADTDARRWDTFGRLFDEYGCSQVPWLVLPGNHEIEPDDLSGESFIPFRYRWRTPEIASEQIGTDSVVLDWDTYDLKIKYDFGGSFYSIRLGCTHFIMLNPYTAADSSSPQLQWLRHEVSQIDRALTPTLLVFTHAPWHHSSAVHQIDQEVGTFQLKTSAEQILVDARADMMFSGHVHAYERTQPIRGITRFVVGHGGNYEELYDEWIDDSCSAFRSGNHYGWGVLDLMQNGSKWQARRSYDGVIVDEATFDIQTTESCNVNTPTSGVKTSDESDDYILLSICVGLLLLFAVCGCVVFYRWLRRRQIHMPHKLRTSSLSRSKPEERAKLSAEPATPTTIGMRA